MAEKVYKPIVPLPKDPECGHLSKEQAQEKWRKAKELDAKMKAYEVKAREEIEAESQAKPQAEPEVKVTTKKAKSK